MSDPLDALRAVIAQVVRDELAKSDAKPPDEYMSTTAAAQLADVAVVTIRRWVKIGKLPEHRAGRLVRVRRADLERLLREPYANDSLTPEQLARRKYG